MNLKCTHRLQFEPRSIKSVIGLQTKTIINMQVFNEENISQYIMYKLFTGIWMMHISVTSRRSNACRQMVYQ